MDEWAKYRNKKPLGRQGWLQMAAIFALCAALPGWWWHDARRASAAIADHGVAVTGTLIGSMTTRPFLRGGSQTRLWQEIEFQDGQGATHRLWLRIYTPDQVMVPRGGAVDLRYLPEDPSRAELFAGQIAVEAQGQGWAAVVFGGMAAAFLVTALFARPSDTSHPHA